MTVNEKKRAAERSPPSQQHTQCRAPEKTARHQPCPPGALGSRPSPPCFWSVLHGETLDFVFLSASLHSYLGPEHAPAMINRSLFDYIHPDEASRARRDLASTFASKSFLGSRIRCRLRRFDIAGPPGAHHLFRRASDSHILQHPAHDPFERKLSLPTIPDMTRLHAISLHHGGSGSGSGAPHYPPVFKRLRTIIEDSVGPRSPDLGGHAAGAGVGAVMGTGRDDGSNNAPAASCAHNGRHGDGTADGDNDNDNNGSDCYLIASIGLYLVSPRLSVMVCHYENEPAVLRRLLPLCSGAAQPPIGPDPILCNCAPSALAMADAEHVQLLLAQVHKLDVIKAFHTSATALPSQPATATTKSTATATATATTAASTPAAAPLPPPPAETPSAVNNGARTNADDDVNININININIISFICLFTN
ncbi:hypothetical protein GGI07_004510 [Coemansia sp. Benny D115]|nr:hypothetical protein GGI07_004510 [Coemansia sp. Benny D115]